MPIVWPPTLPQFPLNSAGYGIDNPILASDTETGPGKARLRYSKTPTSVTVSLVMTDAQFQVFATFYRDTIKYGIIPFEWENISPEEESEWVFNAKQGVTYQQLLANKYRVSFLLEST